MSRDQIRVLGGGWYGCHIARSLLKAGQDVELHESGQHLFSGASGANPARLHLGFHYPRSKLTRAACQEHQQEFMREYGQLTRGVMANIYAVAAEESLVDFGTYKQVLEREVQFVEVDPREHGLEQVEGALLTGERHVVVREARAFFEQELGGRVVYEVSPGQVDSDEWAMTVDCTFCANDAEAIDRFEPCVVGIMGGPTDRAVTIMDGRFPSIYPWDPVRGMVSISSAEFTPLSKTCRTYAEAAQLLRTTPPEEMQERVQAMRDQMARFWPESETRYHVTTYKTAIRAMPRSAADARLVDVVRVGERALRVRAGKIDAVFAAQRIVFDALERMS